MRLSHRWRPSLCRLASLATLVTVLVLAAAPSGATASGHSHCYADGTSYFYSGPSVECTSGYHTASGGHVTGHGGYVNSNSVCVAHQRPSGSTIASDCTTTDTGSAAITYGTQTALARNVTKSNNDGWIYGHGIWYD